VVGRNISDGNRNGLFSKHSALAGLHLWTLTKGGRQITCVCGTTAGSGSFGGVDLGLVRAQQKEKTLRVAFVCGPT
jgi:hypothetical protein